MRLLIGLLIALRLFTLNDRHRNDGEDERRVAELAQARGPRMLLLGLSVSLDELEVIRPSLEDVYLSLTGASSGDDSSPSAPAGKRRGRRE